MFLGMLKIISSWSVNHTIGCNTIICKRYQERVTVIKESCGVSTLTLVTRVFILGVLLFLHHC